MNTLKRLWPAPSELARFTAYREDGSPIYSGLIEPSPKNNNRPETGSIEEQIEFYTKGHPGVYSVVVERFVYSKIEEVPCDRSAELLDTWYERNRIART